MTLVERPAPQPSTTGYDGADPDLLRLHDLMGRGMTQTAASLRLWGPPPPLAELPPAITPRPNRKVC